VLATPPSQGGGVPCRIFSISSSIVRASKSLRFLFVVTDTRFWLRSYTSCWRPSKFVVLLVVLFLLQNTFLALVLPNLNRSG